MGRLRDIFSEHNIIPKKSLGQNFLIDAGIIRKIADAGDISYGDIVVEIGAGMGGLTFLLAQKTDKLLAVEIDSRLAEYLKNSPELGDNVRILNKDILKTDLPAEIEARGWDSDLPITVMGNLPYYITTPIIMKMLEEYDKVKSMVFMVQKEVAERLLAMPGTKDYGSLTVAAGYYCRLSRVIDVPPHCFMPQPGVNSTVLKFERYGEPPVRLIDKDCFFRTVRAAFGQRRKTLLNALANSTELNISKNEIKQIISDIGIDESARGETLSIEQFAELSNSLCMRLQQKVDSSESE